MIAAAGERCVTLALYVPTAAASAAIPPNTRAALPLRPLLLLLPPPLCAEKERTESATERRGASAETPRSASGAHRCIPMVAHTVNRCGAVEQWAQITGVQQVYRLCASYFTRLSLQATRLAMRRSSSDDRMDQPPCRCEQAVTMAGTRSPFRN
jgi:hypothetical protein